MSHMHNGDILKMQHKEEIEALKAVIEQLKEENAVYIIRVLELEKQVDSLMWVWPNDPTPTMGKIILTGELCALCTHDLAWHKSGGKCQNACHCPGFVSDGYIGAWDNDPTAQELEY